MKYFVQVYVWLRGPIICGLVIALCILAASLFLTPLANGFSVVATAASWWVPGLCLALVIGYVPLALKWRPWELFREATSTKQDLIDKNLKLKRVSRRVLKKYKAIVGLIILLVFGLLALFPSSFIPDESKTYNSLELRTVEKGPSNDHPLGLTFNGRDVWTILVTGVRPVMFFGVQAAIVSVLIGGVIGAIAGGLGGVFDRIFTILTETLLAFPTLFMLITVLSITNNSESRFWLIVLYGVAYAAKVVRAEALVIRERDYVVAARATGCSDLELIFNHILVNATPILMVQGTLFVGQAIMLDAYVNFLGVAGAAGWAGALAGSLNQFRALAVYREPWLVGSLGVSLFLMVAAFNLLGEALEEALDVRRGGL